MQIHALSALKRRLLFQIQIAAEHPGALEQRMDAVKASSEAFLNSDAFLEERSCPFQVVCCPLGRRAKIHPACL